MKPHNDYKTRSGGFLFAYCSVRSRFGKNFSDLPEPKQPSKCRQNQKKG